MACQSTMGMGMLDSLLKRMVMGMGLVQELESMIDLLEMRQYEMRHAMTNFLSGCREEREHYEGEYFISIVRFVFYICGLLLDLYDYILGSSKEHMRGVWFSVQ